MTGSTPPSTDETSSSTPPSVVVTGIGLVTCLGEDTATTWKRLLAGESGYSSADPVGRTLECSIRNGRAVALAERAAREALLDAGLADAPQAGVVVGSSRGLQADWERSGGRVALQLDAPARSVAALARSHGPVEALSCACTTGSWAIGTGYLWIRWGLCARVIVGAADAAITPLNLAGFRKAGTLAEATCRPFDRHRSGFILSEGAAILVLEAEATARGRGAKIYARIRNFAANNDAHHPTTPHPDGSGLASAVRRCADKSALGKIDFISAHGTGTLLGDQVEAAVIARLYGPSVPVFAAKGSLGHSLGASSAIETALACLALQQSTLPPITNLSEPAFDLNFVRAAHRFPLRTGIIHSLGFGGQNTALLLEACPSWGTGLG